MSWTIDPAHTTVALSAKHMGLSTARGHFTKFSGDIDVDLSDPTAAKGGIDVDLASIDTGNEQRDTHLHSADFFDVEKFPTMTFTVKSVKKNDANRYYVIGDLTIKGITKGATFDYEHAGDNTDPYGNHKAGGSLTGTIDAMTGD